MRGPSWLLSLSSLGVYPVSIRKFLYRLAFDFLRLIDDVRLPIPTRFFSATAFAFCDLLIEPQVLGVLDEIRLVGLHFLVPLFLEEPQGLPFSSFHFSLNHRLRFAPA